jgi:hypothetical protein
MVGFILIICENLKLKTNFMKAYVFPGQELNSQEW